MSKMKIRDEEFENRCSINTFRRISSNLQTLMLFFVTIKNKYIIHANHLERKCVNK